MTAPDGFPLDPPPCPADPDGDVRMMVSFPAAAGALDQPSGERGHTVAYRVACAADLARSVQALAARRGVDAAALAGAALLLAGAGLMAIADDPGAGEEPVMLDLRLPAGLDDATIRRALALAAAVGDPAHGLVPAADAARLAARVETLEYRNKALAGALERVAFQPLDGRVREVREAAQMFGFVNEWCFDEDRVVRRFRELAPVYHPDTGVVGCRQRMAQLIEARNLLIRHVRTAYASGAWRRRA